MDMVNKNEVEDMVEQILDCYRRKVILRKDDHCPGAELRELFPKLSRQIALSLWITEEGRKQTEEELKEQGDRIVAQFCKRLPEIWEYVDGDLEAALVGDPAAKSPEEVVLAYPGFMACFVYRIAHELNRLQVPILPRLMTEYAHSKTGIDIHPGAQIGRHFFMDHGTGIVIGETAVLGDEVTLYQGVTIGALSPREGRNLAGVKRHPTIENNVTIYAGATVLGGETVIGENAVIGGNAFIVESVPSKAKVRKK